MLVYHGSQELFNIFDYRKIGKNGTLEGKGFYFTDDINIARGYGHNGYLYTVEFSGEKTLSSTKKTITRAQIKKYLKALNTKTDYLSNWGDVAYEGLERVLNRAIKGEYDENSNDVDIISAIAYTSGDMETSLSLAYSLLGFDSIEVKAEWGKGAKLYIALTNDIIKIKHVQDLRNNIF